MKKQTNKKPKKEENLRLALRIYNARNMDGANSERKKIEMPEYNSLQTLGGDLIELQELIHEFAEDDKVIRKIGEKLSRIAPMFYDMIQIICYYQTSCVSSIK